MRYDWAKMNPNLKWQNLFRAVAMTAVSVSLCHLQAAHGPIRVSPNGHYFVDAQGEPFYFLADTQWELITIPGESDHGGVPRSTIPGQNKWRS